MRPTTTTQPAAIAVSGQPPRQVRPYPASMATTMKSPQTDRRNLLKLSGLSLAAAVPGAAFAQRPPHQPISPLLFDVRTYGAAGTGKKLDTNAINTAIEAAEAAGGGTVFFPAGTYLSFSIHLRSNVHLYLAQGATILAAASPLPNQTTGEQGGTYDPAEPKTTYDPYQDYGHNHWHNSLLWGENLHDLSITGPGRIYGKGLSFGSGPGRPPNAPPLPPNARPTPPRFGRGDYPMYQAEQPGVGNKAIALKNCRNVLFRDFQILKGGHFGLLLTGVDNLTIDNLTIDTDRDGMDIDCCKNVHVSNCTVNSPWDDGICPKSSFALGFNKPTENLTITNCYVTGTYELGTILDGTFKKFAPDAHVPRTGRIKCGTESNGGFKNITISNCVFEGCDGLALESEDGALCEDITISNLTMRDIHSSPLFFRLGARLRGPAPETKIGTMQRILVSNITSSNANPRLGSILSGIPGSMLRDIKIANVFSQHQGGVPADQAAIVPPENIEKYPDPGMFGPMPSQGFFLRHIQNLEMSHVEIQPASSDPRPSFSLLDVHRADFYAITAPTTPPAFALNQVTDLRILMSRAAPDTRLD
jgi:polygalacturonase